MVQMIAVLGLSLGNAIKTRQDTMSFFKEPRFKSKAYTDWVCTLNCVVCGGNGSPVNQIVPHHIKGVGGLGGAGLKAPDNYTMPMHVTCHTNWHGDSHINQDLLENQWEWTARTQAAAIVAIANGELKL